MSRRTGRAEEAADLEDLVRGAAVATRDDLGGRGEDVAGVGEADAPQADADDDGARVGSGLDDEQG